MLCNMNAERSDGNEMTHIFNIFYNNSHSRAVHLDIVKVILFTN